MISPSYVMFRATEPFMDVHGILGVQIRLLVTALEGKVIVWILSE